jgi:hypothetical protein
MGFSYGFDRDGFDHRQCSSSGSSVIAGGEVQEREEERRDRQRCQERERVFF